MPYQEYFRRGSFRFRIERLKSVFFPEYNTLEKIIHNSISVNTLFRIFFVEFILPNRE